MKEIDTHDLNILASPEANPVAAVLFGGIGHSVPDNGFHYSDDFITPAKYIGKILVSLGSNTIGGISKLKDLAPRIHKVLKQRIRDIKILLNEKEFMQLEKFRQVRKVETCDELASRFNLIFEEASWDFIDYTSLDIDREDINEEFSRRIYQLITSQVLTGDKVPYGLHLIPIEITTKYIIVCDSKYDRLFKLKFNVKVKPVMLGGMFIKNNCKVTNDIVRLIRNQYNGFDKLIEDVSKIKPEDNLIRFQVASRLLDNRLALVNILVEITKSELK